MLDLAGGSGFPAFPLAREFPDARITLTGEPHCSRGLPLQQPRGRRGRQHASCGLATQLLLRSS